MGKPNTGGPDTRAGLKKARKQQARETRKLEQRRQQRASTLQRLGGWTAAVTAIALVIFFIVRTSGGAVSFAGDGRHKVDSFSLPTLQGSGTVTYASFADKPLVLNFFASWCPYCIAEMPTFERVHQAAGDKVAFLGVSQSDAKKASQDLMRQTAITYPTAVDAAGSLFRWFGGSSMPVTVFIAPGGQITEIHPAALDEAELKSLIQRYFNVTL